MLAVLFWAGCEQYYGEKCLFSFHFFSLFSSFFYNSFPFKILILPFIFFPQFFPFSYHKNLKFFTSSTYPLFIHKISQFFFTTIFFSLIIQYTLLYRSSFKTINTIVFPTSMVVIKNDNALFHLRVVFDRILLHPISSLLPSLLLFFGLSLSFCIH